MLPHNSALMMPGIVQKDEEACIWKKTGSEKSGTEFGTLTLKMSSLNVQKTRFWHSNVSKLEVINKKVISKKVINKKVINNKSLIFVFFLAETGTDAQTNGQSQSKVDLTVESEDGVPADELRRVPADAEHAILAHRRSSSSSVSSSVGRGIQKLTIKMILKEKKNGITPSSRLDSPLTTATTPHQPHSSSMIRHSSPTLGGTPTTAPLGADDLPNGATAANTASYRTKQLLPLQLAEESGGEPVRRAISAHTARHYYTSSNNSEKPRLSSSEVELFKPEIVTLSPPASTSSTTAAPKMESHIPIYERRAPNRESTNSRAYSQASASSFSSMRGDRPVPKRSYERLDIISDDGGRVMREVLEELRGDHITIQVHEKGEDLRQKSNAMMNLRRINLHHEDWIRDSVH